MKQETLGEAAERLYPTDYGVKSKDIINIIKQDSFINGAKWQQERSYSLDDLKEAFSMGRVGKTIKDFNKQFKKQ
jgi:hypothetical protein